MAKLWMRRSIGAFTEMHPGFEEQSPAVEVLETGIKVIDLLAPYAKGGKIGYSVVPVSVRPY